MTGRSLPAVTSIREMSRRTGFAVPPEAKRRRRHSRMCTRILGSEIDEVPSPPGKISTLLQKSNCAIGPIALRDASGTLRVGSM